MLESRPEFNRFQASASAGSTRNFLTRSSGEPRRDRLNQGMMQISIARQRLRAIIAATTMLAAATLAAVSLAAVTFAGGTIASAQSKPLDITAPANSAPSGSAPTVLAPAPTASNLLLGASFANDGQVIRSGLQWRLFPVSSTAIPLKISNEAIPVFEVDPGEYLVHVTYGMASAARRILVTKASQSERLTIAAGGLTVHGTNGGIPIETKDMKVSVFIPSPTNDEDKLISDNLPSGEILRLPEGTYHIVTAYGSSNSTVAADIRVQTGKVIDVVVNHKAARVTLKLVSQAGSEAIANTAWTVLTPGGDVIREELSAFPSMVLAEGTYTAIARNDGKTYNGDFKVSGIADQDVEILRQDSPRSDQPRLDQTRAEQTPRREAVPVSNAPARRPFGGLDTLQRQ